VNRIQIRDYSGDFEDVAELSRQVWTSEYSNKMWFPLWDAMFFRWQVGAQSGALCPVAYDDAKLVGTFFLFPICCAWDPPRCRSDLQAGAPSILTIPDGDASHCNAMSPMPLA
jgi:hypothetical protein